MQNLWGYVLATKGYDKSDINLSLLLYPEHLQFYLVEHCMYILSHRDMICFQGIVIRLPVWKYPPQMSEGVGT